MRQLAVDRNGPANIGAGEQRDSKQGTPNQFRPHTEGSIGTTRGTLYPKVVGAAK
jgi:hypothetical protein